MMVHRRRFKNGNQGLIELEEKIQVFRLIQQREHACLLVESVEYTCNQPVRGGREATN